MGKIQDYASKVFGEEYPDLTNEEENGATRI